MKKQLYKEKVLAIRREKCRKMKKKKTIKKEKEKKKKT